MGKRTSGRVFMGPDESPLVLGAIALRSLGLVVDPATETLRSQTLWLK